MRRDCLNAKLICQFWCAHVVSTSLHVVGMKQDLSHKEIQFFYFQISQIDFVISTRSSDSYFAPLISVSP